MGLAPHGQGSLLMADAWQLAYIYPFCVSVEGPCTLPMEDRYNTGEYDTYMMSTL